MNRLLQLLFLTLMVLNTSVMQALSATPYETPAPELAFELYDDVMVIYATGEGTVTLYIQFINNETGEMTTESFTGDGSVAYAVSRSDEDTYINCWATAQASEDAIPGVSQTEYYIEIPALEIPPYETPAPAVTWYLDDNGLEITATGEGTVTLYVQIIDGNTGEMFTITTTGEDFATYCIPRSDVDVFVNFWATAQASEDAIPGVSQTEYYVEVPAMEVPYQTPDPVVTCELTDYALVITATGEGEVTLYIQFIDNETGEMTTEHYSGEDNVVVTLPRTDETYYINYWADAIANVVDAVPGVTDVEYYVEVPAKEPVYETPAPEVTCELTDDALILVATGEGTVTLYVQFIDNETGVMTTESITGDGTVTFFVPRENEDTYINFWATAQASEDAIPGISQTEYYIQVPAKMEMPPYETPAPEVTCELTDDALVITATGEGLVTLFIQFINNETGEMTTESYDGDGQVVVTLPRAEETYYINYWATAMAWVENAFPGISTTEYFVEIPAKEEAPVVPGDVDGDGKVTISDVTLIIDYILSQDPTGINVEGADFDGDGHVTVSDVTAIIDYILGGAN